MITCDDLFIVTELPDGMPDRTGQGLLAYGARLGKITDINFRALVFSAVEQQVQQVFSDLGVQNVTLLKDADQFLDIPEALGTFIARFGCRKKGGHHCLCAQ